MVFVTFALSPSIFSCHVLASQLAYDELSCRCRLIFLINVQVFPLLMQHFTYKEQAGLVWQFICCIPVNLMEKFLPWLASSLSDEDRQQMVAVMCEVVPPEELLQQVRL